MPFYIMIYFNIMFFTLNILFCIEMDKIDTHCIVLRPKKSSVRWNTTQKGDHVEIKRNVAICNKKICNQFAVGSGQFNIDGDYSWILTIHLNCDIMVGVISDDKTIYQKLSATKKDSIKVDVKNNYMYIIHNSTKVSKYQKQLDVNSTIRPWICNYEDSLFNVQIEIDTYAELTCDSDGKLRISNQDLIPKDLNKKHLTDKDIHFRQKDINHKLIQNSGRFSHDQIDTHIDDVTLHYTMDSIDHDRIINNGRFSHTELDKHITSSQLHFTEKSILHDNITNVGHFTHPQIDTHIRRHDVHFTEESIDHTKIKETGKYSHSDLDFHIDNHLIHHELNDVAIDTSNVWSASKIKHELDKKLNIRGGNLNGSLGLTGDISAESLHLSKSIIVDGVKHEFKKPIYVSWIYNSLEGCTMPIPLGGDYLTLSAENTKAKSGGSACVYKIMASSGSPEIDITKATSTGILGINPNKKMLLQIDFDIHFELSEDEKWVFRLTVGDSHYYYKQKNRKDCMIQSSGKILTYVDKNVYISLSVGNSSVKTEITIYSVMLSIKRID